MRLRSLALVPLLAASAFAVHCGGSTQIGTNPTPDGGLPDAAPAVDGGTPGDQNPDAKGAATSNKVDILFVVDNSASMNDKAELLAASAGTLLRKLAPATNDVHVGVISSSLGSFGGDTCADTPPMNGLAHLQTKAPGGATVAGAAQGFLSFTGGSVDALVTDTESLVKGVGATLGCGLEAQLESVHRFLSAPDPWQKVSIDRTNQARYDGVDAELLAQRAAFLRPDSLVVVVMLTDEDDSSVDPLSIGGQGWAFMANQFPGSTVFRADGKTTTAPRASSACTTNPASPDCTSCGFAATCDASTPDCQALKADPECQKNGGYWGPNEDQLNVRFHRMKERYGIDPQFPLSRYTDALTKVKVPRRSDEHAESPGPMGSRKIAPYDGGTASCTNPLFAASLPKGPGDELCNLPVGPRGKELVVFAVIGGVPETLLSAGAPKSWDAVVGPDPGAFEYDNIDPHMIQSTEPRAGLAPPSTTLGDNGPDPVHGREWLTQKDDLQYACTFTLPTPRTCTASDPSCDCAPSGKYPPLCGATASTQVKAKAYPTIRPLRVARSLGDRAITASICPSDPSLGYAGTMSILAARLEPRIVK